MHRFPSPFSNHRKAKRPKLKKNALENVDFEEEKRKDPKYKTELCKSFVEEKFCKYGNKCRYAHGESELVIKTKNVNYKKKMCKSFFNEGFCTYGIRCNFQHDQRKLSEMQLPMYSINLLLFPKSKLLLGKRLKVFEDITNIDSMLSESTISSSVDNSPNFKKSGEYHEHVLEKDISEFNFSDDNCKKILDFDLNFNINYKNEEENKDNDNTNNNEEKNILDENMYNYIFKGIDIFESESLDSEKINRLMDILETKYT